jgi:hypothetical protein
MKTGASKLKGRKPQARPRFRAIHGAVFLNVPKLFINLAVAGQNATVSLAVRGSVFVSLAVESPNKAVALRMNAPATTAAVEAQVKSITLRMNDRAAPGP